MLRNSNFNAYRPRRVFATIALVFATLLASVGVAAPANASIQNFYVGDLEFRLVESNAVVTDYRGDGGGPVEIPSTANGHPVTAIDDQAFEETGITSVTIPSSVTNIGQYAFSRNPITSVTIPNTVTNIGRYAFYLNRLTSVTIPSSVIEIAEGAFQGNQLTSVSIPSSVTTIGSGAFDSNQLTRLTIPASVTSLDFKSFGNNPLVWVKFEGNAPESGAPPFFNYQLTFGLCDVRINAGATGWDSAFHGLPVKLPTDPVCKKPAVPAIRSLVLTKSGTVKIELANKQNIGNADFAVYQYTTNGGTSWDYIPSSFPTQSGPSELPVPSSGPLVIEGLTLGTAVSLKIRAVNCKGFGIPSKARTIKPRVLATAPIITHITSGSGTALVEFDAPVDNGGAKITRYGYSINNGPVINAGAVSGSLTIKGLKNGGTYSIQIRALNAAGWGPVSNSETASPRR